MKRSLSRVVCSSAHQPAWHFFFFFNDTATTEIYTLSLHDALPIYRKGGGNALVIVMSAYGGEDAAIARSEEHTSELQSQSNLVCRLLLEKKKVNEAVRQPPQPSRLMCRPAAARYGRLRSHDLCYHT